MWGDRRDISFSTARTNGSVFVGLDTILGPVYFATGFDEGGNSAYYLFLGQTFECCAHIGKSRRSGGVHVLKGKKGADLEPAALVQLLDLVELQRGLVAGA